MKNLSKQNIASILLSILFTFFLVFYFVYSSPGPTTIGEDISTTNLTVTSNLSVGGNATTTGNLNVLGNFNLTGIATLLNNLSVSGNASISQNLSVSGTSTLSTTTITGPFTVGNNYLFVDKDLGNVGVGTTDVTAKLTIQNFTKTQAAMILKQRGSLFQKTIGGANYDYGYSIQQTSDGGYVIVGRTDSYGAGNYDPVSYTHLTLPTNREV